MQGRSGVGVTFPSTHRHKAFLPVPRRRAESVRKDPEGEAVIRPWIWLLTARVQWKAGASWAYVDGKPANVGFTWNRSASQ